MQSFEQRVESLTQLALTSSSSPSQSDITQYLRDAVKDIVRKSISYGGNALHMFAKKETITASTGVTSDGGYVLSVLRHDGTVLNPARQVPMDIKGRVTDTDSLFFASKYNPVYYVEEDKIYIKPDPTSSSNDYGEVVHISYDPALNYASLDIANFPNNSEYLVVLYAAAMCCLAKAGNIHSSLPTIPDFSTIPSINYDDVGLPAPPIFFPPGLDFSLNDVFTKLNDEDIEMADKHLDLVEKNLQKFNDQMTSAQNDFSNKFKIYEKELDIKLQNADKNAQNQLNHFSAKVKEFESDLQNYTQQVNTYHMEYQWYQGRYVNF